VVVTAPGRTYSSVVVTAIELLVLVAERWEGAERYIDVLGWVWVWVCESVGHVLVLLATLIIMTMEVREVAGEADRRAERRTSGRADGRTDGQTGEPTCGRTDR
jgi:hypothetical protein